MMLLSGYLVSQVSTTNPGPNLTTDPPEPFNGSCSVENTVFQPGEEIIYKVYYNWKILWVPAGEVRFRVSDTGDQYHIVVQGRTYESYDPFYRVRDQFETYMDKETLLPDTFIRHVQEGKYRRYNKFTFDQENHNVTAIKGVTADTSEVVQHQFNTCMHDVVSILYNLRNYNLDSMPEGSTFPVRVFLEETYSLNVIVLDKDVNTRVRGMGKVKTDVLRTQLIAGEVFNEDDQMTAYVSRGKNRIPFMIESPLTVGKMKAVLVYHDGLKYPLDTGQ